LNFGLKKTTKFLIFVLMGQNYLKVILVLGIELEFMCFC